MQSFKARNVFLLKIQRDFCHPKSFGTFEKWASGVAKLGNICFGQKICVREAKMFLTPDKNIFCFQAAKFVSTTRFPCG